MYTTLTCVCVRETLLSLQSDPIQFLKGVYLVCIFGSSIFSTADITVFRAAFCRFSWFLQRANEIINVITALHDLSTAFFWTAPVGKMVKPYLQTHPALGSAATGLKLSAWANLVWWAELQNIYPTQPEAGLGFKALSRLCRQPKDHSGLT